MRYENYKAEDFIRDDDFIQWVKNPTDEQILFWENWISEHPEKAQTIASAREIILSVRYKHYYRPSESDFTAVWQNIQSKKQSKSPEPQKIRPLHWPAFLRSAAAVLVISLAAAWLWNYAGPDKLATKEAARNLGMVEFTTAKGERTSITLPDGSTVELNAQSKITYHRDFGKENRNLILEGEAFFDVKPDKTKPFRIRTNRLTTTVVGTSFNINAYATNPDIKVSVKTGIVAVSSEGEARKGSEVRLLPHQMSVFEKANKKLTVKAFNPEDEFAWVGHVIALRNADFQEIKQVLEREYSVTFIVEQGLVVKEEFNAKFENEPIEKVLDALNYTSRFQYNLVKDKVYVTTKDEK